jgi:hypothetical protein
MSCLRMKYTKLIKLTLICNNSCSVFRSSIPAKQFRSHFSCHFTKIKCSLTFIVIMIDVCKLKFEIYYCHPYEFRHNLIDTCQHVKAALQHTWVEWQLWTTFFVRHCTFSKVLFLFDICEDTSFRFIVPTHIFWKRQNCIQKEKHILEMGLFITLELV